MSGKTGAVMVRRGRSHPRQRYESARHNQRSRAHLRHVFCSQPPPAGDSGLPGTASADRHRHSCRSAGHAAGGQRPPPGRMIARHELGRQPVRPAPRQGSRFIDNNVDPTTATIKLKATFPNTDHNLWPGLFVQVSLQLSTEANAIVVPASAVQASQQGHYVYVVKSDRTVEMRTVTVERQQGDDMVIARGLVWRRGGRDRRSACVTPGVHITRGEQGAHSRGAPRTSQDFIRRPVATTLLVVSILIFGIMGFQLLPVSDLPTVDFPTIRSARICRARAPRRWPPRSRRRSKSSSRRLRASPRSARPTRKASRTSRCSST